MQQSHEEEDRGGGAGAGGTGAELDETPERSLTTEAVSEAKSFAPSSALASAGATCALYRADEPPSSPFTKEDAKAIVEKHDFNKDGKIDYAEFSRALVVDMTLRADVDDAFVEGLL